MEVSSKPSHKGSIRGLSSTSCLTLSGSRTSADSCCDLYAVGVTHVLVENNHVQHRPVIIFTYCLRKVKFNSHNLSPKDNQACGTHYLPGDLEDLYLLSVL